MVVLVVLLHDDDKKGLVEARGLGLLRGVVDSSFSPEKYGGASMLLKEV